MAVRGDYQERCEGRAVSVEVIGSMVIMGFGVCCVKGLIQLHGMGGSAWSGGFLFLSFVHSIALKWAINVYFSSS